MQLNIGKIYYVVDIKSFKIPYSYILFEFGTKYLYLQYFLLDRKVHLGQLLSLLASVMGTA